MILERGFEGVVGMKGRFSERPSLTFSELVVEGRAVVVDVVSDAGV